MEIVVRARVSGKFLSRKQCVHSVHDGIHYSLTNVMRRLSQMCYEVVSKHRARFVGSYSNTPKACINTVKGRYYGIALMKHYMNNQYHLAPSAAEGPRVYL